MGVISCIPNKKVITFVSLIESTLKVSASLLESVIAKRGEYWENCNKRNYCRGLFDMFVCWPHSPPGNVSVPCPSYLPWTSKDGSRMVHRQCLDNGKWREMENSSDPWRDDSECRKLEFFKDTVRRTETLACTLLIKRLDQCLPQLRLYLFTRKLHCTRNYIHMNLFVSFILRAMAVILKEIMFYIMYPIANMPKDNSVWDSYSSSTVLKYFVACNYFWLLVEAIFLHTLLFTAVLTKRRLLKKYMLLGWGTPVLFVTPWTVVKIIYENTECWAIRNRWLWWIIRGPITLSVLVIFVIFIKILMLLLSKLKADQVKFTDYRYSLARATLVLIPLLGVHEVVFTLLIDECMDRRSRYARNFINLTLSSFQLIGFGPTQPTNCFRCIFLFTHRFQVRNCFRGAPLKHLWKCTRGHRPQCSRQSDSYDEGGTSTTHPHLLQVAVHGGGVALGAGEVKGQGLMGCEAAGLDFLTRKSLSSSDGEMTLGETIEEIIEESEF
uniref:Uncharacterized protein n=1 Tax=Anabas testudineus TaxID=64144 RepID=A0A3Q1H5K3_ANATE